MADPKLTCMPNGPYLLRGPITLVDPAGKPWSIPQGKSVALCRCGQSAQKPWCDGTHNGCGFVSNSPAPPRS